MDPVQVLVGFSGLAVVYVLLLVAHRRIPHTPPADSVNELRADFYALSDQFLEFVEKHDADMGRYHAKVGSLRRKLRKLQEEEGVFGEDVEDEEQTANEPLELTPAPLLDRAAHKAELRRKVNSAR